MACVPGTIACQTLDFFIRQECVWPGQGTAVSVTPCQGVFLIDFFIRFRSDVWPGQRDGRRLFRHAVPGCFPDSKGVLWLGLCAWNNCLPDP